MFKDKTSVGYEVEWKNDIFQQFINLPSIFLWNFRKLLPYFFNK